MGAQGALLRREQFQQARAAIDGIVESVPAVLEEDVAAHLAGELCVELLHGGLDVRVTGTPHDDIAAPFFHILVEPAAAFHLAHDRGARFILEDGPGEEGQQSVAGEHIALLVATAQPVYIPVEADADVSSVFFNGTH